MTNWGIFARRGGPGRALIVGTLLVGATLGACAGAPTGPGPPTSAFGPPPGRPTPRAQALRVVALVDTALTTVPGVRARVGRLVDSASDHLSARVGLDLQLTAVERWAAPEETSTERILSSLEAAAPHPEADLVIALSGAPPPRRAHMSDLSRARYLGRYVVLRSLTPYFPTEARRALHEAELRALLHGVARIFGALPTCTPSISMERIVLHPRERAAWRWSPTNLALMRLHAGVRLRRAGERLPRDIARRAHALLEAAPDRVFGCGDALGRRRALLDAVGAPKAVAQTAAAPAPDPTIADRAAVREALRLLAEGDAAAAYARCAPIAARAPAEGARCAGEAAEAVGRLPLAIEHLRAHLDQHPGDDEAVLRLARLVGRGGDDAAARALLAGYVERHPEDAAARINLGVALARLGDYEGARAQWSAVPPEDPRHADARTLLRQLP